MRRGIAVLLMLCILAALPIVVFADPDSAKEHDARQPDYTRTGSIAVQLLTAKDGIPVEGGTLTMYQTAVAHAEDGNNVFVLTSEFEESGADLIDLESESGRIQLTKTLSEWAVTQGIPGVTVNVGTGSNDAGKVSFRDLELGLYLIVQKDSAPHCEPINPFLVTVPLWDEISGQLVYDVNSAPKCDGVLPKAVFDPPFRKVVNDESGAAPADTKFKFQMMPGDRSYPMPENDELTYDLETGAATIEVVGAGEYEFGNIYLGLQDVGKTYTYKITELEGTTEGFTYDKTGYILKVEVSKSEDEIILNITKTSDGNESVTEFVFTNTYENAEEPPNRWKHHGRDNGGKLPQTGLLWWPAPVMIVAGFALIVVGYFWNRSRRFEKD